MLHIDLLYDDLQSRNAISSSINLALDNFYKVISKIRDKVRSSELENFKESSQIK